MIKTKPKKKKERQVVRNLYRIRCNKYDHEAVSRFKWLTKIKFSTVPRSVYKGVLC